MISGPGAPFTFPLALSSNLTTVKLNKAFVQKWNQAHPNLGNFGVFVQALLNLKLNWGHSVMSYYRYTIKSPSTPLWKRGKVRLVPFRKEKASLLISNI